MVEFTTEQNKELVFLYGQDKNDYQVAEIVHVGRNRLRVWREYQTRKKGLSRELCGDVIADKNRGLSFELIAKKYGVTRTSISKLLNRCGFKYTVPGRKTPVELRRYVLSDEQREFLIGDMFGDGHLCRPSSKAAYYTCSHCLGQEEFVFLKAYILRPLSSRIYYGWNSDGTPYISLSTWSCPALAEFHDLFYPKGNGDKILPVIPFTDKSLAFWFMGDGHKHRNDAHLTVGVNVCLKPALDRLNILYGNLFRSAKYEKQQSIFINDQDKFFSVVSSYLPPAMQYKVPDKFKGYCTGNFSDLIKFKEDSIRNRLNKIPYKILL